MTAPDPAPLSPDELEQWIKDAALVPFVANIKRKVATLRELQKRRLTAAEAKIAPEPGVEAIKHLIRAYTENPEYMLQTKEATLARDVISNHAPGLAIVLAAAFASQAGEMRTAGTVEVCSKCGVSATWWLHCTVEYEKGNCPLSHLRPPQVQVPHIGGEEDLESRNG